MHIREGKSYVMSAWPFLQSRFIVEVSGFSSRLLEVDRLRVLFDSLCGDSEETEKAKKEKMMTKDQFRLYVLVEKRRNVPNMEKKSN